MLLEPQLQMEVDYNIWRWRLYNMKRCILYWQPSIFSIVHTCIYPGGGISPIIKATRGYCVSFLKHT